MTNLTPNGEDTILEPGEQLDNVSAIESRPPVDIDSRLREILTSVAQANSGTPLDNIPNDSIWPYTIAQLKTLIAEQVAAAEQQLLTELLGELPDKEKVVNDLRYSEDYTQWYEGFNKCLKQVVSVIERLQNKTNDGGQNGG